MDDKKECPSDLFLNYEEILLKSFRLPQEMNDISFDEYKNNETFQQLIKNKSITPNNLNDMIKNDFTDKRNNSEFEILKQLTDSNDNHYNYLVNNTDDFDRYSDIRPYKYNHIKLSDKTYINSSRIDGFLPCQQKMFIATQGPKENTQKHFWQMVIENKANLIVMLCKLRENEREKCYQYWPSSNSSKKFDDIKIINDKETEIVKGLTESKFTIYKGDNKYEVTHLLYSLWPDHGVPVIKSDDDVFDKIIEYVNKFYNIWDNNLQNNGFSPIVVHCSAGVGRTGTFMSIYNIYTCLRFQQMYLKKNQVKEKTIYINVWNVVRKIKEQRLISVENNLQYKFIISHTVNMLKKLLK